MSQEDDLQPGMRVPGTQYVVQRTIGRGGHGVVVEVEHAFLAKSYVMKVLHATLADREEVARRMREEARILARIDHPNIVRVVDGGMTSEREARPYFVMSALKGEPLLNVLRRRGAGMGVKAAIHIALDVLDALDAAHMQHQLVHRDIKPANIFLCRLSPNEVRAVLLDFGVARVLASPLRHTQGPTFLGTLRYAAPEQLRGEATFSSDLYAVGICLFETLTGKHPLGLHKAHEDWVRAHTRTAPMPLQECIEAPASLEDFLHRALAKDEHDRFPSAFAMAGALRALLEEIPDTASEYGGDETEAMVLEHALTTVSRKTAWVPANAAAEDLAATPAQDGQDSTLDERAPAPRASEIPPSPALEAFRPSRNPLPDTWKKPRESYAPNGARGRPRLGFVAAAAALTVAGFWGYTHFARSPKKNPDAVIAHEPLATASPTPTLAPGLTAGAADQVLTPVAAAHATATPAARHNTKTISAADSKATPKPDQKQEPKPEVKRGKVTPDEATRLRAHAPIL